MNTYKCVLVGDGGVGKTTYLRMLLCNIFEPRYVATLGVEVHPITLGNVRFNVWDTAGQERFSGMKEGYYVQANCGLVCFDLGNSLSFKNTLRWIQSLANYTPNLVLVGFKSDAEAKVSQSDILNLSLAFEIPYFEISTRTRVGLKAPFEYLKTQLN